MISEPIQANFHTFYNIVSGCYRNYSLGNYLLILSIDVLILQKKRGSRIQIPKYQGVVLRL